MHLIATRQRSMVFYIHLLAEMSHVNVGIGILEPERGVEADFDESKDTIKGIKDELQDLLKQYTTDLK